MEMLRRFVLVGIFVTVRQGSVEQLAYALLTTLLYMTLQLKVAPYRSMVDELLAMTCSLCLAVLFACCILSKYGELTELEDLQARMSFEQKDDYLVKHVSLSAIVMLSCIGTMIALGVILVVQLAAEVNERSKLRRLKYVERPRAGVVASSSYHG